MGSLIAADTSVSQASRRTPSHQTLMAAAVLMSGLWLGVIIYLYAASAIDVLLSTALIGARPALSTVVALAVVTLVGIFVGLIARPALSRGYLVTLIGFGVATIVALGLAGHALAFAVTAWIVLVAWAGGDRLMKLALGCSAGVSIEQRAVFSVTVGLGVLSHLVLGLGLIGLVWPSIYAGLLVLITVCCYQEVRDLWLHLRQREISIPLARIPLREHWLWLGLFSTTVGWLFVVLVQAVAPELIYDSLYYHLSIPKLYLEQSQIGPIRYLTPSYFYLGTEMLYLLGMGLANQTAAKLINVAFYVVLVVAVIDIGRRLFTLRAGIYGALLTMTAPLFAWEASTTYVDMPLALYCLMATVAAYFWWRTSHAGWLLVAGALCGFAFSAKVSAVLSVVPIGMMLGLGMVWRTRLRVWHLWREIVLFSVGFILMGVQWPLIQYTWTGNPIFPMFNGFFQSPYAVGMAGVQPGEFVNDVLDRAISANGLGTGTSIGSLLRLPWAITFESMRFMENSPSTALGMGLVCLPLLALTWRMRRPVVVASVLFLLLCGVLWAFSGQAIRYGMSQLVPANLLAGFALAELDRAWGHPRGRAVIRGSVGAIMLVAGVANLPLYLSLLWNIPERVPYAVAFGRESVDDYLTRSLPVMDAYRFIAADAAGTKPRILVIGEQAARLYSPGMVITHQSTLSWPALNAKDPGTVMAGLRELKVTYVVVDKIGPLPFMSDRMATREPFLDAHLDLAYGNLNFEVFRIPAPGVEIAPLERRNLITDGSFETVATIRPGDPASTIWGLGGAPLVHRSGTASHTGAAAVRVSSQDFLSQYVSGITAGKIYELRMASRSARPESMVRYQIIWFDAAMQSLGVSINVFLTGGWWDDQRMLVKAPAGATGAIVFTSAHLGEVWLDDIVLNEVK